MEQYCWIAETALNKNHMKIVNIIEIIEMPAATAFGLGAIENEKKNWKYTRIQYLCDATWLKLGDKIKFRNFKPLCIRKLCGV